MYYKEENVSSLKTTVAYSVKEIKRPDDFQMTLSDQMLGD